MAWVSVWLVSLVLCWGLPSQHTTLSSAAVYYVTPHSPNPDCPSGEPCLTINEYAQGNHFDGDDNITLLFLNGKHKLTARNFEIVDKIALEMAPSHKQAVVTIQLLNETSTMLQNASNVQISRLKFTSHGSGRGWTPSNAPDCLSIKGIDILSVSRVSIESCQLSLQGGKEATISELEAGNSHIYLGLSLHNQSQITIENSKFQFSVLKVTDKHVAHQAFNAETITNILSLENSSMSNSFVTAKLRTKIVYELFILNTSMISNSSDDSCVYSDSGIVITTFNETAIYILIKTCNIIGNCQGIAATAGGDSYIQLSVDQCYIADNGFISSGGIVVSYSGLLLSNAVIITHITSTLLTRNLGANVEIIASSRYTLVTVFNSTLKNTRNEPGRVMEHVCAACFVFDPYTYTLVNFTQNIISDADYGVMVSEGSGTYEFHFDNTTVTTYSPVVYPDFDSGVGLQISGGSNISIVNIVNCIFKHNRGAAISIDLTPFYSDSIAVTVTKTVIKDNGNGMLVNSVQPKKIHLTVTTSIFQGNNGVSLGVPNLHPVLSLLISITLNNVTFFNNSNHLTSSGVVQVDGSVSLGIEDSCVFSSNVGTPLWALMTTVNLSGMVTFENNIAFRGGAIFLSYSQLRLVSKNRTNTMISIVNNTATTTGGGIYVDQSLSTDPVSGSSCFFEVQGVTITDLKYLIVNVTMFFYDNQASNGGTDIFGATPNSECPVAYWLQEYVFKIPPSLSSISSDPKRVCLCYSYSELMCANLTYIFYHTTRYPGEVFTLSLAVVGFEFGTVTGPVYANLLPQANNSKSSLGSDQHVRQVNYNHHKACTQLNFSVSSLHSEETIVLTANETVVNKVDSKEYIFQNLDNPHNMISVQVLTVPVYINVTLLDCPHGFHLYATGRCGCSKLLQNIGISVCSIYNHTLCITRSGNIWIRLVSSPDGILSSRYCPFGYCKQETINLNLNDPDEQCDLSHTGILCGACPPNLSLAIGSSRCIECSDNYHTLLLIAFAAAGVALVLFIKILDMTVSRGTINGLIFYANIIWANQSLLFSPQDQTSSLLQFLKVFIAWLNLDLGIETCFIQHLDGYWKTWLQFVFPSYIWLIAGLIILVSHYSTKATKIFGNNSVPVLATLFLLSYAKLLRTILIALEFTILEYSEY